MEKMKKPNRYMIHPSVSYRRYDETVVLYLTSQQKVFTFGGSADDILDCFRSYRTIDEAAALLSAMTDTTESGDLRSVITEFIGDLIELGIIVKEYRQDNKEYDLETEVESRLSDTHQLYAVTFELTYRCNEHCRHCYVSRKDLPELSTDQIKTVIRDLREMDVLNLIFTGGELFVRDDAFEILEYAHGLGFVIDIFTNGTLLSGDDYIRLKTLWPRSVHFSLYSHVPQKHDSITQIRGSFEKTLHSAKACVTIGIPVNIKTPIMTETIGDIRGMAELAQSIGASIELGSNITPRKDGNLQPLELKIIDESNEKYVFDTIEELFQDSDTAEKNRARSNKLCGAGDRSISINPYGEVFPCNVLPLCIGNVTETSIQDIWEHSGMLLWWREHNLKSCRTGCGDCAYTERCVFCPGEAMMRTQSPIQQYDEACRSTRFVVAREKQKGETAR